MPYCLVRNCKSFCTNKRQNGFKLPSTHTARRDTWLNLMGINEHELEAGTHFLCLDHFDEKAIWNIKNMIYTERSLPTLNLDLPPLSPAEMEQRRLHPHKNLNQLKKVCPKRRKTDDHAESQNFAPVRVKMEIEDNVPSAVGENETTNVLNGIDQNDANTEESEFFIMSKSRLLQIFKFCPRCGNQISEQVQRRVTYIGTAASVAYFCRICGKQRWASQDYIPNHKVYEANNNLAKAVNATNILPKNVEDLFNGANIACMKHRTLSSMAKKLKGDDCDGSVADGQTEGNDDDDSDE